MNKLGRFLILILILLIIIGGYFVLHSMIATKKANEQVSQTISESMGSTTDATSSDLSQATYKLDLPTATTTTPDNWKTYTNAKLGYSISYPANLLVSSPSNILTLAFPADLYFHWPLQDTVIFRLTASTTCPDSLVPTGPFTATTTFSMNGYAFIASEGDDAAAGNRYQEVIYETLGNGRCYHMSLFDHGTNGAGFYVEGQALIQKYDDQHDTDMSAVISILNSMANSFRLQSTGVIQ